MTSAHCGSASCRARRRSPSSCVAPSVEDPEFGQRLAAFVVPGTDQQLSAEQVSEFVRATLARFKVPRDVCFLDELARNPTGKVLKRTLRELHQQLSPS